LDRAFHDCETITGRYPAWLISDSEKWKPSATARTRSYVSEAIFERPRRALFKHGFLSLSKTSIRFTNYKSAYRNNSIIRSAPD